ncbi:MAG: D-alanyl-D-alanine carboxypeptidase family protein, partial [Pseudomonadota bacterium]
MRYTSAMNDHAHRIPRRRLRGWSIVGAMLVLLGLIVPPNHARAATAVVVDVDTNEVLFAERADQRWYPASITKLMTVYVAFEVMAADPGIDEHLVVRLSPHANSQEPTKLWLATGEEMTLGTAIAAMIVKSANDAAAMVAESVGGALARFSSSGRCLTASNAPRAGREVASSNGGSSTRLRIAEPDERAPHPREVFAARASGLGAARFDDAETEWTACRYAAFIARMNATATRLGMHDTRFENANGLPHPGQITTARDFARLAQRLTLDFPQYDPLFRARYMRYRGSRLRSYNALLRTFTGASGMKTGFICAAGYNIVARAERDDRRLVAVVLGWSRASSRNLRAAELLEFAFRRAAGGAGPRAMSLDELPRSRGALTPPPDIRASLSSRGCRRTPYGRVRFRKRELYVRAVVPPPRQAGSGAQSDAPPEVETEGATRPTSASA